MSFGAGQSEYARRNHTVRAQVAPGFKIPGMFFEGIEHGYVQHQDQIVLLSLWTINSSTVSGCRTKESGYSTLLCKGAVRRPWIQFSGMESRIRVTNFLGTVVLWI